MKTIATFSVKYSQSLNPAAELNTSLEQLATAGIHSSDLLDFYHSMLLIRTFDTKAIALQRTGRLGTYPSCLGQEAISTAIGKTMHAEDVFIPGYRDAATLICRGTTMQQILLYWGGDERGMNFTGNNQDLPYNVPIASQCCHSIGIAYAFKLRREPRVAVVVCGDGGTSEGDFYESRNAAGTWQLPVVFVVINNQWAISVPRSKQSGCTTLAQKAIAGGFSGEQVDGNDIIGCHLQLTKAIENARAGNGPHLIEAITYRLSDHTTADDASRYRDADDLQQAWREEPLLRLRNLLLNHQLISESQLEAIQSQCNEKVEACVAEYLAYPPQPNSAIFEYMYQQMPCGLKQQLSELETQR